MKVAESSKYILDENLKVGDLVEFIITPSGFVCSRSSAKAKYKLLDATLCTGIFLHCKTSYGRKTFTLFWEGEVCTLTRRESEMSLT